MTRFLPLDLLKTTTTPHRGIRLFFSSPTVAAQNIHTETQIFVQVRLEDGRKFIQGIDNTIYLQNINTLSEKQRP
jgi:hypothetical protein